MIEYTRVRLSQWGRWCRGRLVNGYPHSAAFTHADEGERGSDWENDMPADIAEIDAIVHRLSFHLRQPLMAFYLWSGPMRVRAIRCRISKLAFFSRVAHAESWVDRQLAGHDDTQQRRILG
jgi:hypothetical protein